MAGLTIDAATEAAPEAVNSPCRLRPPCLRGRHGLLFDPDGNRVIRNIGHYYFTEDGLEHDLEALRRNHLYRRSDFVKRAKAWYKAEIDRLLHLVRVEEEKSPQPLTESGWSAPHLTAWEVATSAASQAFGAASNAGKIPKPQTNNHAVQSQTAPTRVQPPRVAKRKAALAAAPHSPAKRVLVAAPWSKKTTRELSHAAVRAAKRLRELGLIISNRTKQDDETTGDYSLASDDWNQFMQRNFVERPVLSSSSCRPNLNPQGLEVAQFAVRLEKAINEKITALLETFTELATAAPQMKDSPNFGGSPEHGPQASLPDSQRQLPSLPQSKHCPPHCVSPPTDTNSPYKHPEPSPSFEPAAAYTPGEDWRPPVIESPVTHLDPNVCSPKLSSQQTVINSKHEAPLTPPHHSADFPDQMPEADMKPNPTLGWWPPTTCIGCAFSPTARAVGEARSDGKSRTVNLIHPSPPQVNQASVMEVSGLRFAVDVCALARGRFGVVTEGQVNVVDVEEGGNESPHDTLEYAEEELTKEGEVMIFMIP
ncbi:hypothetical protein B0J18DRAFT_435405 [Chaetomium sp. MPI-SDFR-AT-0129]|nr:hypothetical protein B0J18DRAFT_435405 [Chaetomium sp. MPI-SDFR-AT-0129]